MNKPTSPPRVLNVPYALAITAAEKRAEREASDKQITERGCLHRDPRTATRCGKPTPPGFGYCTEHR